MTARKSEPRRESFIWTPLKILGAIGTVGLALAAFPAFWTFSDHWMNRAEIEKAMKSHADHDASDQAWNRFGFAANRIEYLDDKNAECEAKRMVRSKLAADDAAICARYDAKLKAKTAEAADLKTKAIDSTKEKQ